MTPDWTPLRKELALWHQQGLTLPLWWRDDDAIAPTRALERLVEMSEGLQLPVHMAVIPRNATEGLAGFVADTGSLIPVIHGWSHENHAPPELKKAEFGSNRSLEDLAQDADRALARMETLFGPRLARMFVPPWNRVGAEMGPILSRLGFTALSTFQPRQRADIAPGLVAINTHIDPIEWRGSRGLVDPERLVALTVALLKDRRRGVADNGEPFGYLTHHLVHDAPLWEFSQTYLAELCEGPVMMYRHDRDEIR